MLVKRISYNFCNIFDYFKIKKYAGYNMIKLYGEINHRSARLFTLCCAGLAKSRLVPSWELPNHDIERVKFWESCRWGDFDRFCYCLSILCEVTPCMYHLLANRNICIHFPAMLPQQQDNKSTWTIYWLSLNFQISSHCGSIPRPATQRYNFTSLSSFTLPAYLGGTTPEPNKRW